MESIPFDEQELEKTGEYLVIPGPGVLPKYKYPITPRDNFKLALTERKPLWIPEYYDMTTLCPACYPDAIARGFVCGPEGADYMDDSKKGGKDSFDIDWVYVPVAGGSMVEPGNPLLDDVNNWKKAIHMPDVESWDWAGSKGNFEAFLKENDGLRVFWIFTGLFERLISLMDFEGAAVALIDESQKEAINEFLSACCDAYEQIIKHYKEDFDADVIYFHDDWGSQKAPFFSCDICMTIIVPHLKRIVDYVHSLGMFFQMHSCGMNDILVPCYLEAGIDIWAPQEQNDFDRIIDLVDGKIIIGLWEKAEADLLENEKYAAGKMLADKYCADYEKHPIYNENLWDVEEKFKEGLYVESRKLFYQKYNRWIN